MAVKVWQVYNKGNIMDKLLKSFIETMKMWYGVLKHDIKKKIRQAVCKCGEK